VQRRRRSRITATKETRKATTKQWRTTSKNNKKPGGEKKQRQKNKETVSVCISCFSPSPPPKAELRRTSQKTKHSPWTKLPKSEEEKQKYTPYSLFFFPLGEGREQEKTHQEKAPAEQNDGGHARSEDKQGSVAKRKIGETTQETSQKTKTKKIQIFFSKKERNSRHLI
jgi:hypothetical protein